jgi:MoxR-like ATPase
MKHRIYEVDLPGQQPPPAAPVSLGPGWLAGLTDPEGYIPDSGLVDAVNVALLLGQPMLITGEPGTGKTRLAAHLAYKLGWGKPLVFEAKSTSTARDLFYRYDALSQFQAAQSHQTTSNLKYVSYNALGRAILLSHPSSALEGLLPVAGFEHDGPRRAVVLVDEVDKAPRDFPNDILNELEQMFFRIPELRDEPVRAVPGMEPVVIITSNSEKSLPDAFLRRCVYYNIPFREDRLSEIAKSRIEYLRSAPDTFLGDALDFFRRLRGPETALRKRPATAELLGWLVFLAKQVPDWSSPLRQHGSLLKASLPVLVKTAEDQAIAERSLMAWLNGQAARPSG